MNWIKSQIVQLLARHALNAAGAFLVTKGILSADDSDKAYGALMVLGAVGHSLWAKRALIMEELRKLTGVAVIVPLAAGLALAGAATGCKTYQTASATSGSGLNLDASVPIPMTGGSTLLGLKLIAGYWKNGTVLQPTGTNAAISPSIAINMGTTGNASASGSVTTTSTNGVAGIGAADKEHLTLLTGQATLTSTNDSLTTGK